MRKRVIAAATANSISKRAEPMFCAMAAVIAVVGFVALSPTTSMAQSPFLSTVRPTAPILNPSAPLTLPTPGLSVPPSSPSSLLAPPLYQTPCAGGSLSSSATSLRAVPSVFGNQSSFGPC
jgi:hypothetical protein